MCWLYSLGNAGEFGLMLGDLSRGMVKDGEESHSSHALLS